MSKFAGLGQAGFGGVAPKLAQLTDTVLSATSGKAMAYPGATAA